MPLFACGILAFLFRSALLSVSWYAVNMLIATASVWAIFGSEVAAVGGATSLLIAFVDLDAPPLLFLGGISYSLYLVHVPVGGRLVSGMARFSWGPMLIAGATIAALAACVLAAQIFYVWVEKPAKTLAQRVQIARRGETPGSA
jgi:peptidoglycan/LPS O-acetylase OafA/YrhL